MNLKLSITISFFIILGIMRMNAEIPAKDMDNMQQNHPGNVAKLPMQEDGIIRLSKIEVFPQYFDEYIRFATEVGTISLQTEPGVLTMYAVSEKENPCIITILETYSSPDAYKSHIDSPHFQKYKQGTLHMVKKLELIDQKPLNPANKIVNYIQQ